MNSREKLWLTLLLGARCPRRCPRCGTSGCASCRLGNPCLPPHEQPLLTSERLCRSALVSHSIYLRDGLHCFISEVASKNTRKKTSGSAAAELLIYTSAMLDVLMETTSVQTRKEKLRKGRTQKAFLHSKRKVGEIVFLFAPRLCARVSEERFFLLPRRLHKRRRSMMEMCSIKSRP